jgi:alpha-ketoglutarate-dependent taurine dioxygenase
MSELLEQKITEQQIAARLEFFDDRKLPAVLKPIAGESLHSLLTNAREALAAVRRQYGAILFRGFDLRTPEDFHAVAALCFDNDLRDYIGGVSPRGQVTSGVYESTRLPAHLHIPQHNEMAYLPHPPRELAFFCEVEPQHGGETPLADSRLIYKLVPDEIRTAFASTGISYHRYFYGPRWNIHHRIRNRLVKLHSSWMSAFFTTDPAVVERSCAENGSIVQWDREEGARISSVMPAFRTHPETGEMLWFNQVATFLISPKTRGLLAWLLYQIAYPNPLRRPLHATLGDGRRITLRQLNLINEVIDDATVRFRWQRGDLLLLDNYLITHGRMPYRGDRRILVAIH